MSEHTVTLSWQLTGDSFDYERYSRRHSVIFNGENSICASAAPEYNGDPTCVDPEQAFVSSLASCHMLTFLAIASKRNFIVSEYRDNASGGLGKNQANKIAVTKITLTPVVIFRKGHAPDREIFDRMMDQAHRGCFIANSIAHCVEVVVNAKMVMKD
jgi:organic hydroperoxide reductase OsmC/OhrA